MNANEYEEFLKELESEDILLGSEDWLDELMNPDFKWEYAHESLTESNSGFRRRNPDS